MDEETIGPLRMCEILGSKVMDYRQWLIANSDKTMANSDLNELLNELQSAIDTYGLDTWIGGFCEHHKRMIEQYIVKGIEMDEDLDDPLGWACNQDITFYLMDTVTGQLAQDTNTPFQYAENNWSCDCNRGLLFGIESDCDGPCVEIRFVVVDWDGDAAGYTLDEFNWGYPEEAKNIARQKHAELRGSK